LSGDVIENVGKWALEKRGKYPVNEDDEEILASNPRHYGTLAVIASQRVRAKRGPMTGAAKQSRATRSVWIASSLRSSQ
jgi:hypothetical protein